MILTRLMLQTEYSGLFSQYHACWFPGSWSHQGISRHGIDSTRYTWEKNWPPWLVTVISRWPKWSQPAMTEPWPGPWLSCDLAVTSPWLSCDLAVTELWPSLAVTEPWSLGPGAVTTVVTVSSRWPFIFSWVSNMKCCSIVNLIFFCWTKSKIDTKYDYIL